MKKVIALSAVLTLGLLGTACPETPPANNANAKPANTASPAATTPAPANTASPMTNANMGNKPANAPATMEKKDDMKPANAPANAPANKPADVKK